MTDADYADDLAVCGNIHVQTETRLHSLENIAKEISLYGNTDTIEFMYLILTVPSPN